jgi:hypothetical protein
MKNQNTKNQPAVVLPVSGKGRVIKANQTELDYQFLTDKKQVTVALSIGKETELAAMLNTPIQTGVTVRGLDTLVQHDGQLTLAMLLAYASNGMFEIYSTNLSTAKDIAEQWTANESGFIYKGDYLASLRKPEFSFPTLVKALMDRQEVFEHIVTKEQYEQFDTLINQLKFKGVLAHQAKLAESAKWVWLRVLMDSLGYDGVTQVDESAADLF